jgi:hypothetical protein
VLADPLFITAVTLLELEKGVLLVERRDGAQGAAQRRSLDHQVLPAFEHRILALDALSRCVAPRSTSRTCGRIGTP